MKINQLILSEHMNIIKQASYNKKDFSVEARESSCYQGFIQVEQVSLKHRLFNQESSTPILQRELIHRPEAAGVLMYNHQQQKFGLIEQFRIGGLDDIDLSLATRSNCWRSGWR